MVYTPPGCPIRICCDHGRLDKHRIRGVDRAQEVRHVRFGYFDSVRCRASSLVATSGGRGLERRPESQEDRSVQMEVLGLSI